MRVYIYVCLCHPFLCDARLGGSGPRFYLREKGRALSIGQIGTNPRLSARVDPQRGPHLPPTLSGDKCVIVTDS